MIKQNYLFIIAVIVGSLVGVGLSTSNLNRTFSISSAGMVTSVGIEVYADEQCTITVATINWGSLEPGEYVTRIVYVKSLSNVDTVLHLQTGDWNPPESSQHIDFAWDKEGYVLGPGEVAKATLMLQVSNQIENITNFGFNIVIIAEQN